MAVFILPNGDGTFEVWGGGSVLKDGFRSQVAAAEWANEQGYAIE